MKTVVVKIEAGVIHDIVVPRGVRVVVYDYGIQEADEDRVELDEQGHERLVSIWECS